MTRAMTAYDDTLRQLLASPTTPKLGLTNMQTLLHALGDPQDKLWILHIAGTKGKGSTAAFAASILKSAGLRVGLTTSPHLLTARERIAIDGTPIDAATFTGLATRVMDAERSAGIDASFFEKMIAMAFLGFHDARVDVAVVEVGLGGRLDATNVCLPIATAITRLDIDHTAYLGTTRAAIAAEKAGIIKAGVPVITPPQHEEAMAVLRAVAAARGAPLTVVHPASEVPLPLAGTHQQENAAVAQALVRAAGYLLPDDVVQRGLRSTRWPGRYETLRTAPLLVVDGAHNAAAADALAATVAADARFSTPFDLIVAMTSGHEPHALAAALRSLRVARVRAVPLRSPRGLPPETVAAAFAQAFPLVDVVGVQDALATQTPQLWTGSLYLVGEVVHAVRGGNRDADFPLF